jgi:hypothetical protein
MKPSDAFASSAWVARSWLLTQDRSRGRLQQPGDHPDRRRLAGAVGAEEAVDSPRQDLETDAVHRGERPVSLDEIGNGNHRVRDGLDQQVMPGADGKGHRTSARRRASRAPRDR